MISLLLQMASPGTRFYHIESPHFIIVIYIKYMIMSIILVYENI